MTRGHSRLETRDSYNGLNTTIITNRDLGSVSLLCVPSKHPLQHSPKVGDRDEDRGRERARETLDNGSILMRFACFDKHSSPACLVSHRVKRHQGTSWVKSKTQNQIPLAQPRKLLLEIIWKLLLSQNDVRANHFYEGRVRFEYDRGAISQDESK